MPASNRDATYRVRSALVLLTLFGLASCQQSSATSSTVPQEAPAAVTTLALPGDAGGQWTSFPTDPRTNYSGVRLDDGSVLVCDGTGLGATDLLNCDRLSFDGTQLVKQTFPLLEARFAATLSLLPSSGVLLAGGKVANGSNSTDWIKGARVSLPFPWSDGAQIWGTSEGDSTSPAPRTGHTATLLGTNTVLIGGESSAVKQASGIDVRSDLGAWTRVDVPDATRVLHTATLLPGSPPRVLVLGGTSAGVALSSGFIFSVPDTVTPITDMPEARASHTATLLDDGSVLVVGGYNTAILDTARRYFPADNHWESAGSIVPRRYHGAARLGRDVIIAGGQSQDMVLNSVQRYNPDKPADKAWSAAPNLNYARQSFQLFALDATHLLAVGGSNGNTKYPNSEVFGALALGQTSSDPNLCLSGYVADGVCCESACGDPCQFCNGVSQPGRCQTALSGAPANGNGCGGNLQCTAGACPTSCNDTDHPCLAGYYCASNGQCESLKAQGTQCTDSSQCGQGMPCVDGVCCESACSGSCEACNQHGYCELLPTGAKPKAGHPACAAAPAGEPAECQAACDGSARDHCAFADDSTSCGAAAQCTSDNTYLPKAKCDGKGSCLASVDHCEEYKCDESKGGCLKGCADKADCSGGNSCIDNKCVPCDEEACNALGYRCDQTAGVCLNSCVKSETDCAGSYYCHPVEHRCVLGIPYPASALPACGIGRAPLRSRPPVLALLSALCVLAARRKWRASRLRAS